MAKLANGLKENRQADQNKIVVSNEYGFSIDTDYATYIESADGTYHSYTFYMNREVETDSLENLLVSLQPDGSYKTLIITYSTTAQEKEDILNGIRADLADKVHSAEIDGTGIVTEVFSKALYQCDGYVVYESCSYGNPNHPGGYDANGNACPGYTYDREYFGCGTGGGNDGGSGDGGDGGTGTGDTGSGDTGSGGGGSTGGTGDDDDVTSPTGPCKGSDCPEEFEEDPDPCQKLNDLIQEDTDDDDSVPDIKPTLERLKETEILLQPGENGTQFQQNNNVYSNVDLPATTGNSIGISVGVDNYGAAHTHPLSTFPMFSWSDVYTLFNLYNYAATSVKSKVTFILVCYPTTAAAEPEIYAIVVDDFNAFRAQINADINAIAGEKKELTLASPLQDKIEALNNDLGEQYRKDNDYEKVFLEQFGSHNISLYKSNDDITDWIKLELNESLGTVFETPCN